MDPAILNPAEPPPPPDPAPNDEPDVDKEPASSSGKRKLDDDETPDPHSKIRRIVRDHVSHDPSRVMPMTTIICLHAAVAQKSYGNEKRFLCPPPVVHIEGPVWQMRSQHLSMAVVSETGERSFEQKAPLDNNMTSSFKFLHVTGSAKAKSFQLSLDIAEPLSPSHAPDADTPPGRVWASFDSAPVTIISKPSKKTAKTRNISSCILAGGPVSLFNRINSQTVRTKYMTIDHTQLCASNLAWSAFNVNVVRRGASDPNTPHAGGAPTPVTYGSEIVLSDTHSGITTTPLIIRKVDKGKVSLDDGGPVSQMQKVALQRVNADGSRHYLSAAGPISGTPGIIPSNQPGMASQAGTHPLLFQAARIRDEVKEGIHILSDEVDDYLCWTIVGISKFQYTFFDAFGHNNTIPEVPITPFPTLFTAPVYRQDKNTVELTVSNFFYEDPKTHQQVPLDVYLGNLGPLRHRVYQPSPPGVLTSVGFLPGATPLGADGMSGQAVLDTTPRYMPPQGVVMHTIVMVEMPPLGDVLKALEEDALEPTAEAPAGRSLPLLFIRACDGVGYHSGRTITCDNVFAGLTPDGAVDTGWLEGGMANHGWTLRVM
ncbi:beta-trefoil [Hymenopellis radicata]|nr:beta-trefoil [Hymenopellis radicata]